MNTPSVSFIIPVLNGEKDIARCLTSIRNQHFSPEQYEVLVVDNGSTDRTHQLVRGLRFDLWVVPGVSVGALRNRGVAKARGDYVAFVDADVELMPQWLKNAVTAFQDRQTIAVGCFPRAPRPATWVQQTWEIHQCGNQNQPLRRPVSWLPSMNLLVRRDTFLTIGGFDEQLETTEDVDLCYRLGQHGTILCDPAMEAVHWGEARDLWSFWHKEVWRGMGNLKGVSAHGLRWDEVPSLGYPLYFLAFTLFTGVGIFIDMWYRQIVIVPLSLTLLTGPALVLALNTACRAKRPASMFKLFLLYFLYGFARAHATVKSWAASLLQAKN